jgi:hypothetical protein
MQSGILAGNYGSAKKNLFVGTFADNFVGGLKVVIAHGIVNPLYRDKDVIFRRRWKRFECGTDGLQIPFLVKRSQSFIEQKQWLIGLKFNQAILDPIGVSIAPKVLVVIGQQLQKLRVSRANIS